MVRLEHIAAVLIAASLSGCGFAMFEPGTSSFNSTNGSSGNPEWTRSAAEAPTPPASVPGTPTNRPVATNSLFTRAVEAPPAAAQSSEPAAVQPSEPTAAVKPVTVAELDKPAETRPVVLEKPAAEKVTIEPRGRAYLFRGIAGLI